jgi:hypothetical protein
VPEDQRVDVTYDDVADYLRTEEGFFGFRIKSILDKFAVQELDGGTWITSKSASDTFRIYNHSRLAFREVLKDLRTMRAFVDGCECYTPKFTSNTDNSREYKRAYSKLWQKKRNKELTPTAAFYSLNEQLNKDDREDYIFIMKNALLIRVDAREGDGILIGIGTGSKTIECIYKGEQHFLTLADDGISGPLLVSPKEPNVHFSITGDIEELCVLQQLLTNPWIEEPFDL